MTARPWSTILIAANVVLAAIAGVALAFGVFAIVSDLSSHDDFMDGLGAFIGGVLAAAAIVVGGTAVTVVVLTRRGRVRADDGDAGMLFAAV